LLCKVGLRSLADKHHHCVPYVLQNLLQEVSSSHHGHDVLGRDVRVVLGWDDITILRRVLVGYL